MRPRPSSMLALSVFAHPTIAQQPNRGEHMPRTILSRRTFLATSALAAAGSLAAPFVLRAQGAPVKIGVLHPVTGALSYSGQQGRLGAALAVEEINAAGGIKGLGKIDP